MANSPVRLKYATCQQFSPGGGVTVAYTYVDVAVQNIAFDKEVAFRFRRFDNTWDEELLLWSAHHGDHDLFRRSASSANDFVVRYTTGGQTYWDNNDGLNYHVPTLQSRAGGHVTLRRATARRGVQAGGGFVFTTSWMEGEIFVNNLSYAKDVGVRYSNDGATWSDVAATYAGKATDQVYTGGDFVEIWRFKTPELNLSAADFRFAAFYRIPGTSTSFWDNNFAQDFHLGTTDGDFVE